MSLSSILEDHIAGLDNGIRRQRTFQYELALELLQSACRTLEAKTSEFYARFI